MLSSVSLQLLSEGLAIAPDPLAIERLSGYLSSLQRWNNAFNLTAIRSTEEMVVKHLLDSASIIPWIKNPLLDVGTGAGLPGLVVAILRPDIQVHLLDSNGKKIRFLKQVTAELGVSNIHLHYTRVNEYRDEKFPCVVSRAFASLAEMVRHCRHLLCEDGYFLAMKGKFPQAEIDELSEGIEIISTIALKIPALNEERNLILLR